jgi:Ca-activated chloride channel family protein
VLLPLILLAADVPARAESAGDHLAQGLEAYENEAYETALNAFIKTQLDDPERPEIYYNLGNTYYKLGQYAEARAHYQKALTEDDLVLKQKTLFNLGNTEFRAGRLEEAVAQYEAALKLKPNDEMARKNIEFVKQVKAQQQNQKQESRAADPSSPGNQSSDDHQDGQSGQQPDEPQKGTDPQTGSQPEEPQKSPDTSGETDEKKASAEPQKQAAQDDNRNKASGDADQTGDQSSRQSGHSPPSSDETAAPENTGKASQTMKTSEDAEDENALEQQAARMLNRLEDKPGRAMIPAYRKRQVEKDW